MKIHINDANFLINLFDKHKDKLYVHMRKDGYSINDTLNFINGYMLVVDHCNQFILNIVMGSGYNLECNFKTILFEDCDAMIDRFNKIINGVNKVIKKYEPEKWEMIGVKYAICLATFYIKSILFGNDTYVEDDLYISIPDKNDPDSYDWECRGWDDNYFK